MGTRFTADQFSPIVYGSGAEKLEDSQIAPLVAAVRGYRSYSEADGEDQQPWTRIIADSKPNDSGRARPLKVGQVRSCFSDGGDVMLIPWYQLSVVIDHSETRAPVTLCQARPGKPQLDDNGRPNKYIFPAGNAAPISAHPAFDRASMQRAQRIMVTEGALKEDSLLTAMLMSAGVTFDELLTPGGMNADQTAEWAQSDGLQALRALIARVPDKDLLLPLGLAGVEGWLASQFGVLPLHGKELLIALDGDVKSNPRVWKAAEKLWALGGDKQAVVKLINLGSAAALAQIQATEKFSHIGKSRDGEKVEMLGADDFLSHVGTFAQLLTYAEDELPAKPDDGRDGRIVGQWYVSKDGYRVEEFKYDSKENRPMLDTRVAIGGAVTAMTVDRAPSLDEVRDGVIHYGEDRAVEQRARLTLSWIDEATGKPDSVEMDIAADLLNQSPQSWPREVQNTLPSTLIMNPEWPPPSGDKGLKWMQAIKRNSRREDKEWVQRRAWGATGWVPAENSDPVYIIGEQRLGPTREDEATTLSTVDESILPNARQFGVDDRWWDTVDPDGDGEITQSGLEKYKKQLCADIELVVKHFINSGVWNTPFHGPVLLGAALRTTIPKRPGLPLYLWGTPASGKSWCAGFIMGAWQSRPKVWSEQHLPGSASSTAFALEKIAAVAGGGIWVADDLAPSVSQSAAINAEAGMEGLVRNIFNHSARQRGTKDGTLAKSSQPRAMLVVTAENALTSTSALERALELQFERGVPGSKNSGTMNDVAAKSLRADAVDSLALSRVSAGMIRFWHQPHRSISDGSQALSWGAKINNMESVRTEIEKTLEHVLLEVYKIGSDVSARRVRLIGEVLLPLIYLSYLYQWAGGTDTNTNIALKVTKHDNVKKFREFKRRLDDLNTQRRAEDPNAPAFNNVTIALSELAASQLSKLSEKRVGTSLLTALSFALASRKAHLANPTTPGAPPFDTGTPEGQSLNRQVGWEVEGGEWRAKGEPIGHAGTPATSTAQVVQFHAVNSFAVAQKLYPQLVPHGQKYEGSWRAAIAEGLLVPAGGEGGARKYSHRTYYGGSARPRGPMILLAAFLGIHQGDTGGGAAHTGE